MNKSTLCIIAIVLIILMKPSEILAQPNSTKHTIEKVKTAMLTMQRRSWEQGTAMQGLMAVGDTSLTVLLAHEALVWSKPDGRVAMCGSETNISDPLVNGPGLLFAYKVTGDEKYRAAAEKLYEYAFKPETRTPRGNIRHNSRTMTVWSDNTFMQAPFLAMMGNFDESIRQIDGLRELLWNKEKKLYRHIFDEEKNILTDSCHWGGGIGWNAAGIAQVIDLLPSYMQKEKQKLIGYVTEILDGCLKYQRPDGFFYDKVDESNFVETNLGQMLAYTIYKGVQSGWLDKKYLDAANQMRNASYAKIDKYGLIHDASSSPGFNKPGVSTECQAFFLLMEGAYLKLNQ